VSACSATVVGGCWRGAGALVGERAREGCWRGAVGREVLWIPKYSSVPYSYIQVKYERADSGVLGGAEGRRGTYTEKLESLESLARYDRDELHLT
jgi:hypothetical protein